MAELEPSTAPSAGESAPPAEESVVLSGSPDAGEAPPAVSDDHKRKLGDLEPHECEGAAPKKPAVGEGSDGVEAPGLNGEADGSGFSAEVPNGATVDVKMDDEKPLLDGETDGSAADGGREGVNLDTPNMENEQHLSEDILQHAPAENLENSAVVVSQEGSLPSTESQPSIELLKSSDSSRKIEVPKNKVGVLIGRSGETIRSLQINSGAKIQIMRDADADSCSSIRLVELTGSLENLDKAEQLIKDVIAEADAGGSPALVAQGFGAAQSGGVQTEMQVPNEKVGLIIGKGGETIRNLQTRSGARIQVIIQNLPEGTFSKERTVRITGNKKQTESAKEMIKEVMNQVPLSRPSHLSGGYTQQSFQPHGPTTTLPSWGARAAAAPMPQTIAYDQQPRGVHPPQTTQYLPQPYSGYSQQQPPPRSSGFSTGWDQQRSVAPVQNTLQTGSYDYYGQASQIPTNTISYTNQMPNSAPVGPAPVNYNSFGQSQGPGYGNPNPYAHPNPIQQNYGHVYNETRYDNQAPTQQMYGQQPLSSQPGVYGQQASTLQSSYTQNQGISQSYGLPSASQPGDAVYQGYGSSAQTQQSYPYGSNVASQPVQAYAQSYGPTSGLVDGYNQQPSAGYPQQGPPGPGYSQGGQAVPVYSQPGAQSGGYLQYPSSQPSYGGQPATGNGNYGNQGGSDASYGSTAPSSGYGALPPASGQPGYVQPLSNPAGYYEQPAASQAGY